MSAPLGTYRGVQITRLHQTMEGGIEALQLNSLPRPPLGDSELRVRVHASALNYFDILMLQGRYQYRPALPFTAGSEASGVVVEVGSEVRDWKAGDEVVVGMSMGDALASEMTIPASRAIRKPPQLSHAEASALPVGFFTAYHALVHRGSARRGETLLVTGAGGGMGLAAVQLGVKLGLRVIAAASSEAKLDAARKAGAHHCIDYSNLKQLKSLVSGATGGSMANLVFEVVGGGVLRECIRCTASGGRVLVVGFAGGEIPAIPANLILVKGISLVGVRSGQEMMDHPELTEEMVRFLNAVAADGTDRTLAPLVETRPVDRFREAYGLIAHRAIVGKAVVVWIPEEKAKL